MFKNQKGITLVSLVITIIVMLILAGVSIAMVLGQNGVLNQGARAVENTNTAKLEEEASNAIISVSTDAYSAWAEDTTLNRAEQVTQERVNAALKLGGSSVRLCEEDGTLLGDTPEFKANGDLKYPADLSVENAIGSDKETIYFKIVDPSSGDPKGSTDSADYSAVLSVVSGAVSLQDNQFKPYEKPTTNP